MQLLNNKPLIQRLKHARGTVDVTDVQIINPQTPSSILKLKPGVNLSEEGRKTQGPKFSLPK